MYKSNKQSNDTCNVHREINYYYYYYTFLRTDNNVYFLVSKYYIYFMKTKTDLQKIIFRTVFTSQIQR